MKFEEPKLETPEERTESYQEEALRVTQTIEANIQAYFKSRLDFIEEAISSHKLESNTRSMHDLVEDMREIAKRVNNILNKFHE